MLRVERLSYEIKDRKLLKDISFQVRKGEVLAVLGANGAGKSTLMALLSGDKKPTEGAVIFNGKRLDCYDLKVLSKCRALLSQQQQVTLAFKVSEIVMMGRYPHFKGNPSLHDVQVIEEVMQLCGVEELQDRVFASLSGGEQQRVQFARVLAQVWDNPDSLLLLDEPISALDLQYQQKVLAIAKGLSRRGFMVVMILHDLNFAALYADRIIMLKNGRKLIDGTPIEVLNSKDLYTIFSVESTVELNRKTLKPQVRIEEMVLDARVFNSLLPETEEVAIERRINQLVNQFPYLPTEELAARLNLSELDVWCLDERNRVSTVKLDAMEIASMLAVFENISICAKSDGLKHCLSGLYGARATNMGQHLLWDEDSFRLELHFDQWDQGLFVENESGKSLRFFNRQGKEVHAILLLDAPRDHSVWHAMDRLVIDRRGIGSWSRTNGAVQHDKQPWIGSCKQSTTIRFVGQILASCVAGKIPLDISLINEGGKQSYSGLISNLIDQGSKYMIKERGFELEIVWAEIGKVSYDAADLLGGKTACITFFDNRGIVTAQLSVADVELIPEWNEIVELYSKDLVI